MADAPEDNTENVRRDALRLADLLDGLETRDWVERVGNALDFGEVKFAELLRRRQSALST